MLLDFSAITLTPQQNETDADRDGEQFLRFYLVPDTTAVLPISQIVEVLTIPIGQIVPIPHMPVWVMGVYNWRGEILWIVDLGHSIGLTPWYEQGSAAAVYRALVLREGASSKIKPKMLGLIVKRVEDIDRFYPDLIQSPPASAVSPELVKFLRGYLVKPNGDIIVVLEGSAILTALGKL